MKTAGHNPELDRRLYMWHVFAGWSFVEGYVKKDEIADMIEAL
jgi:hypothetical protein